MYTFTMVGCTLFKLCHCKCAKVYLLGIVGMSRLWHDLMAHGHSGLPGVGLHPGEMIFSKTTHNRLQKGELLSSWCSPEDR